MRILALPLSQREWSDPTSHLMIMTSQQLIHALHDAEIPQKYRIYLAPQVLSCVFAILQACSCCAHVMRSY